MVRPLVPRSDQRRLSGSIYLNEAATALFGYTADELNKHANDHSTRENDASPMFVPPFFKYNLFLNLPSVDLP